MKCLFVSVGRLSPSGGAGNGDDVGDDGYAKNLINRLVESVGKMAKDGKDDGAR